MSEAIDTAKGRLRHARRHLDAYRAQCAEYLASRPFTIVQESYEEDGQHYESLRLRVTKPVPEALRFTIGDYSNQTRSALDNLIAAIAKRHDPTRPSSILQGSPSTTLRAHRLESRRDRRPLSAGRRRGTRGSGHLPRSSQF